MATKSFTSLSKAQAYMARIGDRASLESVTLKGGLTLHVITWPGSTGESIRLGLEPNTRTYAEKNEGILEVQAYLKARDALEAFFLKLADSDPAKKSAIATFTAVKAKRDNWRSNAVFAKGGKVVPGK